MAIKQISFYIFYFFAAFVFFAILCFPQEQAGEQLSNRLSKISPDISIQMEKATPILLSGVDCKKTKIILGNTFSIPFDTFELHFSILDLLKQKKNMGFSGTLLKGTLNGKTEAISFSRNDFSKLELDLTGLHIERFNYKTPDADMDIAYDLTGNATCQNDNDQTETKGIILLTHVVVGMKDSIFNRMGIDTLEFSRIEIDYLLDRQLLTIPKCIATGNVMTLRLKGTLTLTTNPFESLENSSLDLKGFMQPQPGSIPKLASLSSMATLFKDNMQQGIPIQITGSFKDPKINL